MTTYSVVVGRAQTAGYGTVPNKMMPNTFTAIALDLTDNTSREPHAATYLAPASNTTRTALLSRLRVQALER